MITSFTGRHAFLSNFSHTPMLLPFGDEVLWPTAEHAFQAMKATREEDAEWIHGASSPAEAKRRGRSVTRRVDWEKSKRNWMLFVLQAKFHTVPGLAEALAATGDAQLVEGNSWGDHYWGATSVREARISHGRPGMEPLWKPSEDPDVWLSGHNWLGRILMMVREVWQ